MKFKRKLFAIRGGCFLLLVGGVAWMVFGPEKATLGLRDLAIILCALCYLFTVRHRMTELCDKTQALQQTSAKLQESEARARCIVDSALDCIIAMNQRGLITEFNSAAEQTFGYPRTEVLGRELAETIIPPSVRDSHRQGLRHYLATGETLFLGKRIETVAMRADGSTFPAEIAITSIPLGRQQVFTAVLRDITERVRGERRRQAQYAITHVLAESARLAEGTSRILEVICETLGWDLGEFWIVDRQLNCLCCQAIWHNPSVSVPEFIQLSRQTTFAPGVGLPGRVWANGKPAWIADISQDPNFPLAPVASQEGLQGAFALPIRSHQEILGVLDFLAARVACLILSCGKCSIRSAPSWASSWSANKPRRPWPSSGGLPPCRRKSGSPLPRDELYLDSCKPVPKPWFATLTWGWPRSGPSMKKPTFWNYKPEPVSTRTWTARIVAFPSAN
jgi:PAS domain S-box-containing protein